LFELSRNSLTINGFSIRFYGVLMALGVLLGVLLASRREKRVGVPEETTLNLALLAVPISVICARLYYVIFEWDMYRGDLLAILNVRRGGLAIYGAVLGGVLEGLIYARWKKVSFWCLADLAAPSLALGQAIGRWGNFLNEEAYGVAITNPKYQFFPAAVYIRANGLWHAATFFYESIWCFLILAFLLGAERKRFFRKSGDLFLWYGFLYALERGAVEGLRTDSLYWGTVRVSQLLSLLVIFAVALAFAFRAKGGAAWRFAAPILCLAAAVLVGTGVLGSVSPAALSLYIASLVATFLLYGFTPKAALPQTD
jgi:phosphatidylglycerol:prolipoprotein diacylglycerol transferase